MKKAYLIAGSILKEKFARNILKNKQKEDKIISIDKGLKILDKINIKPDIIIGDFDSIDKITLSKYLNNNNINIKKFPVDKDYSDTELAIKLTLDLEYKELIILGALGKRMDHTLSNIYSLVKYSSSDINIYLIDEFNKIYIKNNDFEINKSQQYGKYISFYPIEEEIESFSLEGFKYNLKNVNLNKYITPSLSLSNEILENIAKVYINNKKLLVIESKD